MSQISSERRVARKDHVCGLCLGPIRRGFEYSWSSHECDGTAFSVKEHVQCIEFMRDIDADDEMWFHGAISEFAHDYPVEDNRRRWRLVAARPGRSAP